MRMQLRAAPQTGTMACRALVWAAAASAAASSVLAAPSPAPPPAILAPGERLTAGAALTSGSGWLAMQPNGVLAVCQSVVAGGACATPVLWEATYSPAVPGAYAFMTEYGCLEVRHPNGTRLWWTHTMALAGCTMTSKNCSFVAMQDDGNCVMHPGTPGQGRTAVLWSTGTQIVPADAKNVLHIVVDDLRPAMNKAYHQSYMITPTFDRLASEGLVFDAAYTNIAVCAPSRNSFMSGLRPDVTGIFNFANHIREPGQPDIVTTPQQFRKAGWVVLGGGKTFHYSLPPYFDDVQDGTWSSEVQPYFPFLEFAGSSDMAICPVNGSVVPPGSPASWQESASMCVVDGDECENLYDCRLANHTVATLERMTAGSKPWYVMAGFRRPHRNFKVHRKYWDLYPDSSTFATAKHKTRTASQPLIAFHPAGFKLVNGTSYPGDPDNPWPNDIQQMARKGYAVAVTQTDAYVGRVLDALDASGQAGKTVVVLHSDHGWQLGEHGLWDKQTEFELATRVPLIIKVPWKPASAGKHTSAFAELVDIHPTLASLAGLRLKLPTALPPSVASQATGSDLSPLFDNPGSAEARPGKNASFSQWPVCTRNVSVMCMACTGRPSSRVVILAMGYSIRTREWRYTVWLPFNTSLFVGEFRAPPIAVELYDHRNSSSFDFDIDGECDNVADDPAFAEVRASLHAQLQAQYTWDEAWLTQSRQALRAGQLREDVMMGMYPYPNVLPVPPGEEP